MKYVETLLDLVDRPHTTEYRGYSITQEGPGDFVIEKNGHIVTRNGSAWSCKCYIDELLSP